MGTRPGRRIDTWLGGASSTAFAIYATSAAFGVYFCMYAYRKPFAVGTFGASVVLPGLPPLDYKIALILAQVLGYTVSKFYGVKVISEISASRRAVAIVLMIVFAEAALLLFALVPVPYSIFCLFLNGLPLGMVWGLVFGFLEGRRFTEALGAGLSTSYIVSSGFVKFVGKLFLDAGVPEAWMPFATGLIFLPPLLAFVWLLGRLPPPSVADEELRTRRRPMFAHERRAFLIAYAPGLFLVTVLYVCLTAYRDFRDNFAREIWDALGFEKDPAVFAVSETIVTLGVLIVLGGLFLIRSNRAALLVIIGIMLVGAASIGVSTLAFFAGWIGPSTWMVLIGLGLYTAYVPYGCILFERLIAATGFVGTAGFMIYFVDAFGYAGSTLLLLYKNFATPNLPWLDFFVRLSYGVAGVSTVCFVLAFLYFARQIRGTAPTAEVPVT